ncbi:MAG: twitching motility protein PilT, partial [Gammaproteobacteria bacterium]|nr:twitching motility protein PilT [Gammaproteobacteria bacterium]
MRIDELLAEVSVRGASDLHISEGLPPSFRVDGELRPLADFP